MNIVSFNGISQIPSKKLSSNQKQTSIPFEGTQQQDVFVRSKPAVQQTVAFTGGSAKKIHKAIPESKELAQKVVQGDTQALTNLENAIRNARSEGKINREDLREFNGKLADNLLSSALKEPTNGKAENLVRTNMTRDLVINYLNEYHKCVYAAQKIIGADYAQRQHNNNMSKQLNVINSILTLDNGKIRAEGRKEIKNTLSEVIKDFDACSYTKNRAMEIFVNSQFTSNQDDLNIFISQIKNTGYVKRNRIFAIECLPIVLNQCLEKTKPEEVRNVVVRSANALGYVLGQESRSGSQKQAARKSLEQIATSKSIPGEIREELVKLMYNI